MKRKKITEGADGFFGETIKQKNGLLKTRDMGKIRVAAGYFATFFLSLMLSAVRAPMGIYPFSYAVVGAASGGAATVFALAGAICASFTIGGEGLLQSAILLAVAAARLFVCFMKGDFRSREYLFRRLFRERGYIKVIIAAAGAAAFGCVGIIRSESLYYALFAAILCIFESAIITASFIFFANRGAEGSKRLAGLAVLALGSCASLDIFGLPFSLGAVAAFLGAVYFSRCSGGAVGAVVGFAGGLSVGGKYSAAFCAAGLMYSLLKDQSAVGAVVAAALTSSVVALFSAGLDSLSDCLPEIALGAAFAVPLISMGAFPDSAPPFLELWREKGTVIKEERGGERYQKIGNALKALSSMLSEIGDKLHLPSKQESGRICAAARAKYCSGCVHEKECRGSEGATVDSMFSNMAYRLTVNGRVSARIVPESVARRCFNMDGIISSVNSAVRRGASLSGKGKSQLFCSDYSAMADLLKEVSDEGNEQRDAEGEELLSAALAARGFSAFSVSVFGKRDRRVYLRGISSGDAGERDIRELAERVLSARLSSPEFSIDGKYVNASMRSVPSLSLEGGSYSIRSRRDNTSGDSVCSFENDEGYHYTLVSDGMGSGREAAVASGISAAFLEKLLSAGCPMRSALELLNCFVRGCEGECFATVDLMETDLYTGRARFIKSGAAPSFVIRRGQLYRIHSKTIPVGIMRALDAEAVSFDLLAGDTVIMMSDGVTGSYEESPWLYDLLTDGIKGIESPEALARTVADTAAENTGREDDITVCVLKVS